MKDTVNTTRFTWHKCRFYFII